jgi:lysophospholipase L1-like esterase
MPSILASGVAFALVGCAAPQSGALTVLPPGAHYVAMGSSFAGGPGITDPADSPTTRCQRSRDNYPHQLARRRGLKLTDVSCGGAMTAHILSAWNELPAQADAVRPDTRLVTLTIGGNDVNYSGGLLGASCVAAAAGDPAKTSSCRPLARPTEAAFASAEKGMRDIVAEIRSRAPQARIIFVDYLTVLPPRGTCAKTPLAPEAADTARWVAGRVADMTARVARDTGSGLFQASKLSQGHDACSREPWMNGYPATVKGDGSPYHPTLSGMTAVADALDRMIPR